MQSMDMNLLSAITGETKLVGLIGWPVEHSLSPAMNNAAFSALGLDYCYVPLPVAPGRLKEAVEGLRALGFVGANVTVPHKEAVMAYLDEVTSEARAIGAVNTIVVQNGRLTGYNTDWRGFLAALRDGGFAPEGKRAVVLGAGGAARAAVYALGKAEAEIAILNRNLSRAEALVRDLSPLFPFISLVPLSLNGETLLEQAAAAHLLVNATSLGMWPEVEGSPWPESLAFPSHLTVFDLVYNPGKTKLIKQAEAAGARAISGLGMLVHQGAEAFRLWTGVDPPLATMYEVCEEALGCCDS